MKNGYSPYTTFTVDFISKIAYGRIAIDKCR